MSEDVQKDWFSKFFTIVVPVGLVFATIIGILIHVMNQPDEGQDMKRRQPRMVSEAEVADIHRKLGELLGDRGVASDRERLAMKGAQSFIAGSLSPENAGYAVETGDGVASGGDLFRPVWVDLKGDKKREVVRVIATYSGDQDDAAATAAALSVAQAMSADRPPRTLRFLFISGLEANAMGLTRKNSESYKGVIWVGESPPANATGIAVDPNNPFIGALELRQMIDAFMER